MEVLALAGVMAVLAAAVGWFVRPVWEPDRRRASLGLAVIAFVATLALWFVH